MLYRLDYADDAGNVIAPVPDPIIGGDLVRYKLATAMVCARRAAATSGRLVTVTSIRDAGTMRRGLTVDRHGLARRLAI